MSHLLSRLRKSNLDDKIKYFCEFMFEQMDCPINQVTRKMVRKCMMRMIHKFLKGSKSPEGIAILFAAFHLSMSANSVDEECGYYSSDLIRGLKRGHENKISEIQEQMMKDEDFTVCKEEIPLIPNEDEERVKKNKKSFDDLDNTRVVSHDLRQKLLTSRCRNSTNNGKDCGKKGFYQISEEGKPIVCRDFCYENAREWLPFFADEIQNISFEIDDLGILKAGSTCFKLTSSDLDKKEKYKKLFPNDPVKDPILKPSDEFIDFMIENKMNLFIYRFYTLDNELRKDVKRYAQKTYNKEFYPNNTYHIQSIEFDPPNKILSRCRWQMVITLGGNLQVSGWVF